MKATGHIVTRVEYNRPNAAPNSKRIEKNLPVKLVTRSLLGRRVVDTCKFDEG